MKRSSCFLLLYILLASCATAPAFTATKAPTKPLAFTNTPEAPTSTETPTMVPTSTETPDPMAGAPEGATGKNAKGEWIKAVTENGQTTEYAWTSLKDAKGEVLFEGWTDEKTQEGGIPLLDYSDANLIPLSLFVAYDVPGGRSIESLSHQDNIDQGVNSDTLTATVIAELYKRHFHKDAMQLSEAERLDYRLSILNGEARLPFITSTGESVEGKLSFITIVVPFDSLVPAEGNGVSEWLDPYPEWRFRFRSTVLGVDKDGNIIGLIASEKPLNELPDSLVRMLVLYHPGNITNEENQETQGFPSVLKGFIQSAGVSGAEKVPDIIVTRSSQ